MVFHECFLFVLIHFSHLKRNCLQKVKYFKIYLVRYHNYNIKKLYIII